MYVPSLVKIHWRMLILECSQGCYTVKIWPGDLDLWPITLKINRVPDSLKDQVCTKFGQNPLKDVVSRVFTRMLWKNGSVTISLRNFVGEGIIKQQWTIEEIFIFSNSSQLEWRTELSGTTLKGTHPGTIPARLGLIWFSGFRGEDLNVKVYDVRWTDGRQVMAKAHMAFGQVS